MTSWISDIIVGAGYAGIAILMFVENIFPPIPSEVIMPLAGVRAADGRLAILPVIISGTIGSVLGALPWYILGRRFGEKRLMRLADRHGRWLTMRPDDVHAANGWFRRHGLIAVLGGRLVPTVRTLISVPAGLARMNIWLFLAATTLGSLAWTAFLALVGFAAQTQWRTIGDWIDTVATVTLVILLGIYLFRIATWRQD